MFSISPDEHAMDHIRERTEKLFLSNEIRLMELLEGIQYGVLYLVAGFATGVALDYSFPPYIEQVRTSTLFAEVALQCLLLVILTYYLRKVVKIVPFLFMIDFAGKGRSTYKPYQAEEYGGEIMIALVFLGAQFNLIKKLDLLSRRFYAWLYDEEKTVGESMGI
ncbi:MAG: hypothetical protein EBU82_00500 [Flavobacteriia bacterium]|nr:hypothetical protein [Flavobacteriia bacterium]